MLKAVMCTENALVLGFVNSGKNGISLKIVSNLLSQEGPLGRRMEDEENVERLQMGGGKQTAYLSGENEAG